MKFFYTLFLLLFLRLAGYALHSAGIEIFYDHVGQGSYKITLVQYRNSSDLPSSTATISTNHTLFPTVTLTGPSSVDWNTGCISTIGQTTLIYTGTVNFGNIPTSGIELTYHYAGYFTASNLNTTPTLQYFTARTLLLANPNSTEASSSPRSHHLINFSGLSTSTNYFDMGAYDPDLEDSVYVSFTNVSSPSSGAVFAMGYSYNKPFGNTVATHLHPQTGLLTVGNAPLGKYYYNVKIESYRNGVKTSEVERHRQLSMQNSSFNYPGIHLSNIGPSVLLSNNLGNSYSFEMNESDTLSFDIKSFTSLPKMVLLSGLGNMLDSNIGWAGNCSGPGCASFLPTNGSYNNMFITKGKFKFVPDTTFVPSGSDVAFAHFVFKGTIVDTCYQLRTSHIAVVVEIHKQKSIWSKRQYLSCNYTPIQALIHGDNSNLSWSPSTGVSNNTSATPVLTPTSTTTYTVSNLNNGEQIKILVEVDLISPPILSIGSNTLTILNGKAYDKITWYYNGVVIDSGDVVSAMVAGNYYAVATKGKCSIITSTHTVSQNNQVPLNSALHPSTLIYGDGTFNMQFKLKGFGNVLTGLAILMPDPYMNKTSMAPIINILNSQKQIIASAIASPIDNVFWKADGLNVTLNPNQNYEVQVLVNPGLMVLYKPDSIPYTDPLKIVEITSAEYLHAGVIKKDAFPYMVFEFQSGIGIEETILKAQLYPNPIRDWLIVDLVGSGELEIYDATGRRLKKLTLEGKTRINMEDLPFGVYGFKLWNQQAYKSGIFIK